MSTAASGAWGLVVVALALLLGTTAALLRPPRRLRLRALLGASWVLALGLPLVVLGLTRVPPPAADWVGDYSTGNLSQWSNVQTARPDAIEVVRSPVRKGYEHSARFEVAPGDRTFGQTEEERAELSGGTDRTGASEGQERWYAWSFRVEEQPVVAEGGFLSLGQWHQTGPTCPPNVRLLADDGRLRLNVRGGALDTQTCRAEHEDDHDLGPLTPGRWVDVEVGVRWASGDDGSISVSLDGAPPVVDRGGNLYDGQGSYLKQGIYRTNTPQTLVLHTTGTRVGPSAASVALRGCTRGPLRDLLSRDRAWC